MTIDRSTLPDISENIKQFWQPQRTDYSSGGIAYCNTPLNSLGSTSPVPSSPSAGSFDAGSFDAGSFDAGSFDAGSFDAKLSRSGGFNLHSHLALISTHDGRRWQLPKGTVEPQESSIQTALREVEEETGLLTEFESFIETVEYWYWDTYNRAVPMLVHKRVDFYLLPIIGGELSDLSFEVDAVAWFTPEQALQKMTFAAEMETLRKALNSREE